MPRSEFREPDDDFEPHPHSGFPRIGLSRATLDAERRSADKREAADEAAHRLMSAAEALTALCDRHSGDSGDCAETIENLTEEVIEVADKIRATLGEPRVRMAGGLVPASMVRR